ncbi:hypothetical protein IFM89_002347 [Coptis chinensis]|uniref:MADS-box domain-containing protein n=1 Tax=Coptis chinensis TaxID=261450 RepID=A0A835M6X2_9MAGN|nr:hypothetical protein IFM89_002347 [Coptis chinensis]
MLCIMQMVRGKLNMQLISNEKSSNVTFGKRKDGLKKKLHEFTTLCGVDACMIVYGPNHGDRSLAPETWPENKDEVHRILSRYCRSKVKNNGTARKDEDLSKKLKDRRKKQECEHDNTREKNDKSECSMGDDHINKLSEDQLKQFSNELDYKIDSIQKKIEWIRWNQSMPKVEPRMVQQNQATIMDQTPCYIQPFASLNPHSHLQNQVPTTAFAMGATVMNLCMEDGYNSNNTSNRSLIADFCYTTLENQQYLHDRGTRSSIDYY